MSGVVGLPPAKQTEEMDRERSGHMKVGDDPLGAASERIKVFELASCSDCAVGIKVDSFAPFSSGCHASSE